MALHLHKFVFEVLEMPYEEFLSWISYLNLRPVGWREDDRTFKLLQAQGVKEKPWHVFSSLRPIYNPPPSKAIKEGQIDFQNLKRSVLFSKIVAAEKGDVIEWSKF